MNKRRKADKKSSNPASESAPLYGLEPNDPPKKNSMFLFAASILFLGWIGFLVWLSIYR